MKVIFISIRVGTLETIPKNIKRLFKPRHCRDRQGYLEESGRTETICYQSDSCENHRLLIADSYLMND